MEGLIEVGNFRIPKPTKEQLANDFYAGMTWNEMAQKYGYKDSKSVRVLAKEYGLPQRRIILKPTKEQLEDLIVNQHKSPKEIAHILGYSVHGATMIRKYCREYGIQFNCRGYYELRDIPLTARQKSIILGTLLGDGYLRPTANWYALSITHSSNQSEYAFWLKDNLMPFVKMAPYEDNCSRGFGNNSKLISFNTVALPFYSEIHDILYINGIKTITRKYLDLLDELALAVWFMDDGSLNKRYGFMSLATDPFPYEQHQILVKWFKDRWDIEPKIEPKKRRDGKYVYNLRFNRGSAAKQLRNLLASHIPSCMSYKVTFNG